MRKTQSATGYRISDVAFIMQGKIVPKLQDKTGVTDMLSDRLGLLAGGFRKLIDKWLGSWALVPLSESSPSVDSPVDAEYRSQSKGLIHMTSHKYWGIGIASALVFATAQPASAQDRYRYCQQRAAEFSGYNGRVPDRYLPGGALEGAAKGAATSGIGGLIFEKNKKKRKRDVRRGAALGALFGAIKRGNAKKQQNRAARNYRLELDACMRGGY